MEMTFNTSSNVEPTTEQVHIDNLNQSKANEANESENEGNVYIIDSNTESPKKRNSIKDFEISYTLGRGSYAKVALAKNIFTDRYYALKIIDKKFLEKLNKQYEVHIEKYMLSILVHPNIIKLYSTFQDKRKLYFILEYCPNHDLSDLIRSMGTLPLELAKFYSAEIVSALEYMHRKGIYHRDLKPENIVLDEKMHLKILDFATANIRGEFFDKRQMRFVKLDDNFRKMVEKEEYNIDDDNEEDDEENCNKIQNISRELVGTTEYVSPEVLSRNYGVIGPPVDLWALGIIIYLFLHGKTPFKERTQLLTFDKILNSGFIIDETLPEEAKGIIIQLLDKIPHKRLGAGLKGSDNDYTALKSHPFFKGIDFGKLSALTPPIDPKSVPYSPQNLKKYSEESSISPNSKRLMSPDYQEFSSKIKRAASASPTEQMNKYPTEEIPILQLEKDEIVFETVIQKKSPWFHYNTRLIRLVSSGRLEYYEPHSITLKGTIPLDSNCKAVLLDQNMFNLITKRRTYVFWHQDPIANVLVQKINDIIGKCTDQSS